MVPATACRGRYRVGVTAAAAHGPRSEVEKTPDAIRAALLPEERDAFDVDCRQALGDAAAQSSLTPVHEVLDHWHTIARMTLHDPAAHRRMLQRAEEVLATGTLHGRHRTWEQLRAERGL